MAASYPTTTKSFTTKLAAQTVASAHVNDLQDEVVAIEGGLRTGLAHALVPDATNTRDLGATGNRWKDLFLAGVMALAGGQIAFPSTQAPSTDVNTLDDYEEGSWTPTMSFGGGTTGITYSVQNGRYVKVGKSVFISGRITLTAKGSSTGNASINGLPFTNENVVGAFTGTFHVGFFSALASSLAGITLLVPNAVTRADFYGVAAGGGTGMGQLSDTTFSNTSDVLFSGWYPASA